MKKERFDAITDAVLAIIITIMVLELKIPELTTENIPQIVQQIAVYSLSFLSISILWMNHHHIFIHNERVSLNVVWTNFCLLFITSLIPLATAPLSEHFFQRSSHIFYAAVLGTNTLIYTLLQDQNAKYSKIKIKPSIHWMNWLASALYFSSIPLSHFSLYLSGAVFVLCPALYFTLSKKGFD